MYFVHSNHGLMYLYWGDAWVWSLCHQAQIGGVSQWCFSHLYIRSWSSTICVLITSLTKTLRLLSLARSRKSPGCFKRHTLRIMEAKCSCEPSTQQNCFLVFFPRSVSTQSRLSALLTSISDVKPGRCVCLQIISNQLNLPQVNSSQSIETSQRRSSETRMLLN